MQNDFQPSWIKWKIRYILNRKKYYTRRKNDIWTEINSHQLDRLLDELAEIYINASSSERSIIFEYVKKRNKLSWEIVLYIRRIALRLKQIKDEGLIYRALGMAMLVSKSDDPRDILISLILLKVGATKYGIDIKPWYNKIDPVALTNTKGLFFRAENQTLKSVNITISKFGPPEWN